MRRFFTVLGLTVASLVGSAAAAFAVVDSSVVDIAQNAGADFKDTAVAVIVVLVPLAIGIFLARRALPWAKQMLGR